MDSPVDHHAAAHQTPNLKAVELVLENCLHDLEAIPPIPDFEDPALDGIAEAAFVKGFEAGVNEAFQQILAIELLVTAVEIAVIEGAPLVHVAVVELASARAVRRALDALRAMPMFVPLAVNGTGVVMRVARGSSRALKRNMMIAGRPAPLAGEVPHHIAAHGDKRAIRSVEILERFGLKADYEANGVNLPAFKTSPNPLKKVVHGNLHTDAYHAAVEERLKKAVTQADAERILRKIAWELEHGIITK